MNPLFILTHTQSGFVLCSRYECVLEGVLESGCGVDATGWMPLDGRREDDPCLAFPVMIKRAQSCLVPEGGGDGDGDGDGDGRKGGWRNFYLVLTVYNLHVVLCIYMAAIHF